MKICFRMSRQFHKLKCFLATMAIVYGASAQYSIDVTRINETVYLYRSYFTYQGSKTAANSVLYAGSDSVVIIDTPWDNDQTRQLLNWVEIELKKPVACFIITHAHEDRIGGISVLKEKGIRSYSTKKTATEAVKNGYLSPDRLFQSDTVFRSGNANIEVFYPGPGHTVDNIVVYFPAERILYGGCFLKSGDSSTLGNLADADLAAWPASLERVKRRYPDATLVVPGHGGWGPGAIENTAKLLQKGG